MILDQAFILYTLSALFSLYGLILFVWWWIKAVKVSGMYKYLTLFFLSNFILMGTNSFARWHKFIGSDFYFGIFEAWWWPARLYLHFFIVVIITGHMSYRAFWKRWKDN